jgi:gas vesicle protein
MTRRKEERMDDTTRNGSVTSVFVAFAAGAAVGAVAALLLAPRSGGETRSRIAKTVRDTKDLALRVPVAVREASDAARDAFKQADKVNAPTS